MAHAAKTLAVFVSCSSFFIFFFATPYAEALIIPQELPTILSVLYSNIPPILKGTDSRLGLGFRFGPHADFQVLLELGPQTYTKKLGPDADADAKKRRQASPLPSLVSLAAVPSDYHSAASASGPDTVGSRWLSAWRSGLVNPSKNTLNLQGSASSVKQAYYSEENDVGSHLTSLYENKEKSVST